MAVAYTGGAKGQAVSRGRLPAAAVRLVRRVCAVHEVLERVICSEFGQSGADGRGRARCEIGMDEREPLGGSHQADSRERADKLVTTQPDDQIVRTGIAPHGEHDPTQQIISGGMAERVVGRLEAVHVEKTSTNDVLLLRVRSTSRASSTIPASLRRAPVRASMAPAPG